MKMETKKKLKRKQMKNPKAKIKLKSIRRVIKKLRSRLNQTRRTKRIRKIRKERKPRVIKLRSNLR